MRRVVITSELFLALKQSRRSTFIIINSKSGITFAEEYKEHNLKSHVMANQISNLKTIYRKTIRFMGSGSAYNYIAMKEAIKDQV